MKLIKDEFYYCAEGITAKYLGKDKFLMPTGKLIDVAVMKDNEGDVFTTFIGTLRKRGE